MRADVFKKTNKDYQQRINNFIGQFLNSHDNSNTELNQAIRYSLLAPGKRFRPLLCYATARALRCDENQVDFIAASLEMIHAYSLIHDDLPAMDDDDLRRGQATCHIKYGEATAILAGDALQTMAFELLTQIPINANIIVKLILKLSQASGVHGMVGGQALDLASENESLKLGELKKIHQLKTGALISASVEMVGLLNNNINEQHQKILNHYGQNIGMSFQIIDDVLDVVGDEAIIGKPIGSDQSLHKSTYPELMGLEQSKQAAIDHSHQAINALTGLPHDTTYLKKLAEYLITRQY